MQSTFVKTFKISNVNKDYVEICPDYGGIVANAVFFKNGKKLNIIEMNKQQDLFETEYFKYYNQAKLCPFANRIANAKYEFRSKIHILYPNEKETGHALHGFLNDKKFNIASKKRNSITLFYDYAGDIKGYNFPFLIIITYKISKTGVECQTEIENIGNEPMPLSDGWHPYFSLDCPVDELFLKIPSIKTLDRDDSYIPNSKFLTNKKFLDFNIIGKTQFNDCFVLPEEEKIQKTIIWDKKNDIKLVVWQETGYRKYNFIQFFIPPHRKSIAIEPMTSAPDAFNNKIGLIILEPKEKIRVKYGFYLE